MRARRPSSRRTRRRTTGPSRSAATTVAPLPGPTRTASGLVTVARAPSRSTFRIPRNRATQSSAGRAHSSSGVATWATRPARRIATRSPSAKASPTSCVTWTTVSASRSNSARRSSWSRSRNGPSRAPSGSSRRSVRGRGRECAREGDALCLAARQRRDVAVARVREADERQRLRHARLLLRAREPGDLRPEGDVLRHGAVWEERGVLEHEPDPPAMRGHAREVQSSSTRTRPDVGRSRPATTRSRVDFPAPLGPSRARRSPVAISSETSSTIGAPPRVTSIDSSESVIVRSVRGRAASRARRA